MVRQAKVVYEEAGFKYLKTIQVPEEAEPEFLMRIERTDVLNQRTTSARPISQ